MPYYDHIMESLLAHNVAASADSRAMLGSRDIFGRLRTSDPETTGGYTIQSGYVVAGSGSTRQSIRNGIASRLPLTLDAAGSNPINLSVVVTSMASSASVAAALNWRGLR